MPFICSCKDKNSSKPHTFTHSSDELENRHSFALLMKGKAIGAKIEKSGYRILKFLVAQPPNPIVSQSVCGESQSGEEVCMTLSVES